MDDVDGKEGGGGSLLATVFSLLLLLHEPVYGVASCVRSCAVSNAGTGIPIERR